MRPYREAAVSTRTEEFGFGVQALPRNRWIKPALDLAGRGLDGLVLGFVRIYEVGGADGNIVQGHAAVDKFDVVARVPMVDLCDVVLECLTFLVDRQDLVRVVQLEEGLGTMYVHLPSNSCRGTLALALSAHKIEQIHTQAGIAAMLLK